MLIRNKQTKTVHEVAAGTLYPKGAFEEVTKEQLDAEKASATAEKPSDVPKKSPEPAKPAPAKKPTKPSAKKPAKKKTNKK